jgi:toxin ParE1/3/4
MPSFRIETRAAFRIDDIYRYTRDKWGDRQAETYINGLFTAFDAISKNEVLSRPVPASFGVEGFVFRCQHHFIYWKRLANGDVGIVTVLHERMHQIEHFREDFRFEAKDE